MDFKYTRQDYMDKKVSHHEYYSQFVNDTILNTVTQVIGEGRVKASKDEHFNDIPLEEWDMLAHRDSGGAFQAVSLSNASTTAGGVPNISLADKVCVFKAAAKIIAGR